MELLKVKIAEPKEAVYREYKTFDNINDYLKYYNDGKNFVRVGYENWKKVLLNEKPYYVFSYDGWTAADDIYISENVYKEILKYSKKGYAIHESDLFRTQKNSNCRSTGQLGSEDEVISYLKGKNSWLPTICKEIDEDIQKEKLKIQEIENKIKKFEKEKLDIVDQTYLKSKIKMEYSFDSALYKQLVEEGLK